MSIPNDLLRVRDVMDDWDHYLRDDSRLASWAFVTVDPPETDRDLGQLADWAVDVTERRTA